MGGCEGETLWCREQASGRVWGMDQSWASKMLSHTVFHYNVYRKSINSCYFLLLLNPKLKFIVYCYRKQFFSSFHCFLCSLPSATKFIRFFFNCDYVYIVSLIVAKFPFRSSGRAVDSIFPSILFLLFFLNVYLIDVRQKKSTFEKQQNFQFASWKVKKSMQWMG